MLVEKEEVVLELRQEKVLESKGKVKGSIKGRAKFRDEVVLKLKL